jgi:alpha-tubulin suppressor-like RCC1 family protein
MNLSAEAEQIVAIAAGDHHIVVVKNDGSLWVCGANEQGQLGDGSTNMRTTPIQLKSVRDINAVACGSTHTLASTKGGAVWAWGNGETAPKQIADLKDITAVAAGSGHSLALRRDGTVWSWGSNHRGQLGNGTTNNTSAPVQVTGLTDVTAIAAGRSHSVALRKDGTVWSWGANNDGQLGDGTNEHRLTPVQVKGLTDAIAIAAGYYHTAAIRKDGSVVAWGGNESESWQLADGTTMMSMTPVSVTGQTNLPATGEAIITTKEPPRPFADVVKIACGAMHTLAIKSDGSLWAWGTNHYWGQLGDGSVEWRTNPVQPRGMTDCVAVAAGKYHSVALKKDGTLWTWGGNTHGQLGIGTNDLEAHPIPTRVHGL